LKWSTLEGFRHAPQPHTAVTEAALSAYSVPEKVIDLYLSGLGRRRSYGQGRHAAIAVLLRAGGWISGMRVCVEDSQAHGATSWLSCRTDRRLGH